MQQWCSFGPQTYIFELYFGLFIGKIIEISHTVSLLPIAPSTESRLSPWGYFCQNSMWMYLPNLKNLTFSLPIFRPTIPTYQYTFFDTKSPNFVCLLIAIPNFEKKKKKKKPQKADTYRYTMSMWEPPRHLRQVYFLLNLALFLRGHSKFDRTSLFLKVN